MHIAQWAKLCLGANVAEYKHQVVQGT